MMRIRLLSTVTSLLAVLSCKGSEVSGVTSTPMTLTIEPVNVSLVGTRTSTGQLRCPVDLTILAHGTSDHLLTLQSVSAGFTIDGVSNNPAVVAPNSWFGVGTLRQSESAVTHRQPTADKPFVFTSIITYADQFNTVKTVTSTVACTE